MVFGFDPRKLVKDQQDKKKKKVEQKHELLYIMSPQCGWCKKADPTVDELKKKYDIRT